MALGTQTRASHSVSQPASSRVPAAAFDLAFVAASSPVYAKPPDLVLSAEGRHLDVADTGNSRIVRYRIVG